MQIAPVGVPIHEIPKPALSLANVRWVTEIPDPEDSSLFEAVEMFSVVGEQYRLDSIEAAARAIAEEDGYLPPRFWLVPDNANAFDPLAVAVYVIAKATAFHIGFLPKGQARQFREQMQQLSRVGESLEVLGCITQGKSSPHPNGRVYLPVGFAALCLDGFSSDEANRIAWVDDASPIVPRAATGRPRDVFSFEELCKIYCWHARKRRWFCFPHDCEAKAEGIRSAGVGLAVADFEPFMRAVAGESAGGGAPPQPAVNLASQWFYEKNGQVHGPFDAAGLRNAANVGRLNPTDRVRRGDLSQWAVASRVKGLFVEPPTNSPAKSSTPSLATLLFQEGDLPAGWSVGPFEPSAPKMFDNVAGATNQGGYPLLFAGNRKGGVTGFVFQNASDATRCYEVLRSGMSENATVVARLGDAARFSYMRMEMPPQLKLPPTENTDLVFVRGTIVVHIRMGNCQPEPVVAYAARIDSRLVS